METKTLIQVDNFIVDLIVDGDAQSLMFYNVAGGWEMRISNSLPIFTTYLSLVEGAMNDNDYRAVLTGTLIDIYVLTNYIPHTPYTSNKIAEIIEVQTALLRKSIAKLDNGEDNAEACLETQERLDGMFNAAAEEAHENSES